MEYIDNKHLINIVDKIYLMAYIQYMPLKYRILIDKCKLKKEKYLCKVKKKQNKKINELNNELYNLERKYNHYNKWKDYILKRYEDYYFDYLEQFYNIVNKIFNERIKGFKHSNWDSEVKDDAYLLYIEQIYKYFFKSYRKNKKRSWLFYNDYLTYEKLVLNDNRISKEYDEFGMLKKPKNINPFSYITNIVNTSMLINSKLYKKFKKESVYFEALIEYDINYTDINEVNNFEEKYIFNYDKIENDFDDKNPNENDDKNPNDKKDELKDIVEVKCDNDLDIKFYDYISNINFSNNINIDVIEERVISKDSNNNIIDFLSNINTYNLNKNIYINIINLLIFKIDDDNEIFDFFIYLLNILDTKIILKMLNNINNYNKNNLKNNFEQLMDI